MLSSTFEEDDLPSLKVAFDGHHKSLVPSPQMNDMQPTPGCMDDYMQCGDGLSLDNNHNLMSSMMTALSGQSHYDDLSSSIINSQNLSPFANNFLNSLCPSPQSDMLLDGNGLLQMPNIATSCDSSSGILYLNSDKNGVTSTVADSSSGSVCTSVAASSTDVDDALFRSIEEGDCFFDSTPSPLTPAMSCPLIGANRSSTGGSLMSPVMSSPEDGCEAKTLKRSISELPPPPKKPLSPYMRFSKGIWQKVKAANPGMTVCEVGANIGRVWRELSEADKKRFNEEFLNDKARYDTELQRYLQATGLQASDLVKPRTRKKDYKEKPASRKTSRQNSTSGKVEAAMQQELNLDLVSFQSPGEVLTPVGLPSFSQVWSQSDLIGQDGLISDMAGQNAFDGSTVFTEHADHILNGMFLNNSMLSQNSATGDLQTSLVMQAAPTSSSSSGPWATWQQLPGDSAEHELMGVNQGTLITSLQSQLPQQQQQIKRLMSFSVKSNNDIKQINNLNLEGLTSNGLHSELLQAGVDAEKVLLRSALVEKSQEVLRLMKELEQAYGLIHQLKQQNDFFHQHWNPSVQQQQQQQSNTLQFAAGNAIQQHPVINSNNIGSAQHVDASPKSKELHF